MVVAFAVVPYKLYIVECLLDKAVLLVPELLPRGAEVHGILDNEGIVGEPEGCVSEIYISSRLGSGSRRTRVCPGCSG